MAQNLFPGKREVTQNFLSSGSSRVNGPISAVRLQAGKSRNAGAPACQFGGLFKNRRLPENRRRIINVVINGSDFTQTSGQLNMLFWDVRLATSEGMSAFQLKRHCQDIE